MPNSLENLDRRKKKNFLRYMKARPVYFRDLFKMAPTAANIAKAHEQVTRLAKEGMDD